MPIGVGAALAIGLGSAGASAASSIYGAKSARGAHDFEIKAQERQAQREMAMAERSEANRQRMWQDYVRLNQPTWQMGGRVLQSLYDLAGGRGQGPGAPVAQTAPMQGMSLQALANYGSGGGAMAPRPAARLSAPYAAPAPTNPMAGVQSLAQLASYMPRPSAG